MIWPWVRALLHCCGSVVPNTYKTNKNTPKPHKKKTNLKIDLCSLYCSSEFWMGRVLSSWVEGEEGWNWMSFKVISNTNQSEIPWFLYLLLAIKQWQNQVLLSPSHTCTWFTTCLTSSFWRKSVAVNLLQGWEKQFILSYLFWFHFQQSFLTALYSFPNYKFPNYTLGSENQQVTYSVSCSKYKFHSELHSRNHFICLTFGVMSTITFPLRLQHLWDFLEQTGAGVGQLICWQENVVSPDKFSLSLTNCRVTFLTVSSH